MVTAARITARMAYVLRQLRFSASRAVSGAKAVEARPCGERDDGEGADPVFAPPPGDGGEGGLIEGGRHGRAREQPSRGEDAEVGRVREGEYGQDAQH